MEQRKAQKRPFDLNTVLDDSLRFETWDSDPETSSSPEKRPKLSVNDGSGDDTHNSKRQRNGDVPYNEQTLQCQKSDLPDYPVVEKRRGIAEDKADQPDTLGCKVNGDGVHKFGDDTDDSQDTVILSEDENVEENEQNLARTATLKHDVQQNGSIAEAENDSASSPSSSARIWKDTSIETDAGMITSIIPDANKAAVMDCLVKHRADPDRLNIVMAKVLDRTPSLGVGASHSDQNQTTETSDTHGDQAAAKHAPEPKTADEAQGGFKVHTGVSEIPDTSGSRNNGGQLNNNTEGNRQRAAEECVAGCGGVGNVADGRCVQDNPGNGSSLYKDVKNVIVKIKEVNPQADINPAEVYTLLEQYTDQVAKVDMVCNTLLEKYTTSNKQDQDITSNDIFNQAMKLNLEFPRVDPSEIYELLEKEEGKENAFQAVREKLQSRNSTAKTDTSLSSSTPAKPPPVPKDDSVSNDPLVRNDPVFKDMRIISKMFPEKDQNELYALVEAHYYKTDRVQAVIEELLQMEKNSQDNSQSLKAEEQHAAAAAPVQDVGDYLLHIEVDHLRDIFPDCDPNYIFERLEACKATSDRIKVIAAEMFEKKDYPRLKDMQEKQTKAARKRHLQNMEFTLEEFLAKFPDPGSTFSSTDKEMKEVYRNHVDVQLRHDFPDFRKGYVKEVVQTHNHHLLPIVRDLEVMRANILARGGRSKKLREVPKEEPLTYPEEPDEYFFYELWYTLNEQKVKDHFEEQAALRQVRVEEARARSELYECHCCFEDELLFEDMNTCADGHLFCRQCIARSAEAAFGEGKTAFPCLTGTCEHQIPLSVLKEVLPSSMFSKMLRKLQEEEVRQAEIPDLVECPFCSFATIMADPNDRVFRCLNPQCLKDSCRLCREPNHVPLRCEEVEKQKETDMRTFIEKRVTEAMLRKCHRCGKHFVKDVGCNKMTCICGATSCYVCREPDIDYGHFTGNNCTEGDMNELHRREMERAAREAREEYLRQHPDAADIELKYDPAQHIAPVSGVGQPGLEYDSYDDEVDGSVNSEYDEDADQGMFQESDMDPDDFTDSDEVQYPWFY